MKVPVYLISERAVNDAWSAYRATQIAARSDPALLDNEYFKAIQDTAYARFLGAFEAL